MIARVVAVFKFVFVLLIGFLFVFAQTPFPFAIPALHSGIINLRITEPTRNPIRCVLIKASGHEHRIRFQIDGVTR